MTKIIFTFFTKKLIRNKAEERTMNTPKQLLKYLSLFTHPEAFFKAVAKEKDYWQIIAFVAGFAFLGNLIEFLLWWPLATLKDFSISVSFLTAIAGVVASPVLTLLTGFIAALVVHLGVLLFHGQERFFSTWKVVAYASIIPVAYNVFTALLQTLAEFLNPFPEQSLMWGANMTWGIYSMSMTAFLTIVGIVALVHVIYAEVKGIILYHKLTNRHAVIATVILPLVAFLLILLLSIALVWLFRTRILGMA